MAVSFQFMFHGCVFRHEEPLQLQNIFEYKAELKKTIEAKEAERKRLEEESKSSVVQAKPANVEKSPEQILKESKLNPPEAAFLQLPDAFTVVSEEQLKNSVILKDVQKTFPGCTTLWVAKGMDVVILAGKIPLNFEHLVSLTKEEFRKELQNIGSQYDSFYQSAYHSRASYKIDEKKSLSTVAVASKYVEKQNWRTDLRYIYIYTPEYRLNIMISGSEEDIGKIKGDIDAMMGVLEKRLVNQFPNGIQFRDSSAAPDVSPK